MAWVYNGGGFLVAVYIPFLTKDEGRKTKAICPSSFVFRPANESYSHQAAL